MWMMDTWMLEIGMLDWQLFYSVWFGLPSPVFSLHGLVWFRLLVIVMAGFGFRSAVALLISTSARRTARFLWGIYIEEHDTRREKKRAQERNYKLEFGLLPHELHEDEEWCFIWIGIGSSPLLLTACQPMPPSPFPSRRLVFWFLPPVQSISLASTSEHHGHVATIAPTSNLGK